MKRRREERRPETLTGNTKDRRHADGDGETTVAEATGKHVRQCHERVRDYKSISKQQATDMKGLKGISRWGDRGV